MPETLYVPVPRIRSWTRIECEHLSNTPRETPLNVVIQWRANQYHLYKVDLSAKKYQNDVSKAIELLYTDYRYDFWRPFVFRRIKDVEYVKVILSCFEKAVVGS